MARLNTRLHRLEEALPAFAQAILNIMHEVEGIHKHMATKEDFTALSAAVTTVADEISVVAGLLGSGQDNNNQATIDALTARLTTAAEALKAVIPAPASTDGSADAGSGTGSTDGSAPSA